MRQLADHPVAAWVLAAAAFGIAAAGAKPFAGSWNDGSRLAAVESVIDRGTLAIDDSIFCRSSLPLLEAGHPPYPPDRADLILLGTWDKLYVRGRFYSDKPPLVSILMAGAYRCLMVLGLPGPADRPDVFCRTMTVLTSGLGYAIAVGCLWVIGRRVGLPPAWRGVWLAGFAFGTYALTYTEYVNSHAVQLGTVATIAVLFLRLADRVSSGRPVWGTVCVLGTLAGLGFNLDFGSGPVLVAAVLGVVAWRTRRAAPVLLCAAFMTPWVATAVGINYAIADVWKPLNMYPEHFRYPGSQFTEENLTGFFRHGVIDQFLYAAAMLIGKHGFWNHNLPLLLAAVAGPALLWHSFPYRGELVGLLGWCAGSWLLYAALSNNMCGGCCSVRWFVPFLVPGFWLLAEVLRQRPQFHGDYLTLSGWGAVLAAVMWWNGPWILRMVPMMWPIVGCALLTWGVVAYRRKYRTVEVNVGDEGNTPSQPTADRMAA